jgi:hypothetical protein
MHSTRFLNPLNFYRSPRRALLVVAAISAVVHLTACQAFRPNAAKSSAATTSTTATAPSPSAATPLAATHPIIGTWRWPESGKGCTETWQFSADRQRNSQAAGQTTQGQFEVAPRPSLLGFYRLVDTVQTSNGKPDCSGDMGAPAGAAVTSFVQFSPALDQFIVCQAESLAACFGPFRRVPVTPN